jgi:hypothetical protein
MKKLVLTAVASLACVAAFAQGKISFQNDSLHLAVWGPSAGALAGTAVNSDNMPGNVTGLSADLYMGTSSSQLFLYSSTTFGAAGVPPGPGKWNSASVQAAANGSTGAPLILGGTTVFVEAVIRSTERGANPTFNAADASLFTAYGASSMFTFVLGSAATYPPMWNQSVGTWAPGGVNMDAYGPGSRGAIQMTVVPIPEPGTFALAGLGAAAMLIFRRRK